MSHLFSRDFRVNCCIAVLGAGCVTVGWRSADSLRSADLTSVPTVSVSAPGEPKPLRKREPPRPVTSARVKPVDVRDPKPAVPRMERYRADRIISPLSPAVIAQLREVAARVPGRSAGVFMKVGDSHLSNLMTLGCFAPRQRHLVHLGKHRALASTLEFLSGRLAVGRTSFDRLSRAAYGGMSIPWVLRHRSRRLRREIRALNPRYAVISFGTNDMDRGTPRGAMKPYVQNLKRLLKRLLALGVIPIVLGLPPRTDTKGRAKWAVKYNEVTRRIAESAKVLYINQQLAVKKLPRQGLAGDGVHATLYARGIYRACDFSTAGLRYGTNMRNLLVLKALHLLRKALDSGRSHGHLVLSELPVQGRPRDT